MKVLVTGFTPFNHEAMNPAYEAARLLPDSIENARIIVREIPTEFHAGTAALQKAIEQEQPDVVLCIGQAGGRAGMSLEKVAINYRDARIPDNAGFQPIDTPIKEDGPAAYFARLPLQKMVSAMHQKGIPAFISYSAGTYVCNDLMYNLLDLIDTHYPDLQGGFIHVPYAAFQVIDKPSTTPSMSLQDMAAGLHAAIEALVLDAQTK